MLKLNAGFSRKVGEPNYGSRGASVNVELELDSNLIGDPDALLARINNLFDLARRSVDAELAGGRPPSNNGNGNGRQQYNNRFGNSGTSGSSNGNRPTRSATASQARAIRAICNRRNINADQFVSERYGVSSVEQLTLPEASALIDELKNANGCAGNGGGR